MLLTALEEVETHTNVSETYYARIATEAEAKASSLQGGDLSESQGDVLPEEVEEQPAGEEVEKDDSAQARRICPPCGSHDINEVEDKTCIVSYIPKPMYAKKLVCRRCSTEFG